MKKRAALASGVLLTATGIWIAAQTLATQAPLATLFPGGPLLYVEAADFGGLLRDWNRSVEKKLWLASANYSVFSRSRLFERLRTEQEAFAGAAGFTPGMSLLDAAAGAESALAIYDIGKLEFLYITRLPASRLTGTVLGNLQSSYESRNAAGISYFVRTGNGKTAAIASTEGLLLLATREDLLASALAFIARKAPIKPLSEDPWFAQASSGSPPRGELRLVLNVQPLLATPYFRSYWIQRNRTELLPFASARIDVFREANRIREERVLLRSEPTAPNPQQKAAGQLLGFVPPGTGLHKVWAAPPLDLTLGLIADKIVAPGNPSDMPLFAAPAAADLTSTAGTEADLETAIDQPPLPSERPRALELLRPIVQSTGVDALLEAQTSRRYPDGIFVGNECALVLLAPANWPEAAVRAALPGVLMHVSGRTLIVADRREMLERVVSRLQQPALPEVAYAAVYRHRQEFAPWVDMMRMIDAARTRPEWQTGTDRQPAFFSENLASLGNVVPKLEGASITATDNGAAVTEHVLYTFTQ